MPKAKDTEYRDRTATAERTEYQDPTATAEKTEYHDRTAIAEKAEFTDEKTEDKTQYPAENRDNSYLAANQHMVKFADELRGINEQAALSFDRRKNPAEYDLKEKQEMLEAVTEAFNAANWNSAIERRLAADDIAQNLYHPMYPRLEITEAAVQHKLPDEFIQELKQEKIEYFEKKHDEAGVEALQLTVAASAGDAGEKRVHRGRELRAAEAATGPHQPGGHIELRPGGPGTDQRAARRNAATELRHH